MTTETRLYTLPYSVQYNQKKVGVNETLTGLAHGYEDPDQFLPTIDQTTFTITSYMKVANYYFSVKKDKAVFEFGKTQHPGIGNRLASIQFHPSAVGILQDQSLLEILSGILKPPVVFKREEHRSPFLCSFFYSQPGFTIETDHVTHTHPSLDVFLCNQQSYSLKDLKDLQITVKAEIEFFNLHKKNPGGLKNRIQVEVGSAEDELILAHVENQLEVKKAAMEISTVAK